MQNKINELLLTITNTTEALRVLEAINAELVLDREEYESMLMELEVLHTLNLEQDPEGNYENLIDEIEYFQSCKDEVERNLDTVQDIENLVKKHLAQDELYIELAKTHIEGALNSQVSEFDYVLSDDFMDEYLFNKTPSL